MEGQVFPVRHGCRFFHTANRGVILMAVSPQEAMANYLKGMAGAGAAYAKGTGAVTASPMDAAAAAADKAMANYVASLQSGQWASRLRSTPISYWKQQCAAAGARLASGAQKGAQKYQQAMAALAPVHAQMAAASASAGDDPIAKVTAALSVLLAAGKKGKASGY